MSNATEPRSAGVPLLTGLGSLALLAALLWIDDEGIVRYVLLLIAAAFYVASAIQYILTSDG